MLFVLVALQTLPIYNILLFCVPDMCAFDGNNVVCKCLAKLMFKLKCISADNFNYIAIYGMARSTLRSIFI